jgi:methylamine dehydrogenase accessory protein MauD
MTEALLVSNLLLWVLVVALGCVVVALTRQIGVLHERVAPAGALAVQRGPEVGDPAPRFALETLGGSTLNFGGEDREGRRTLLFFLSPTCPVCKTLLPTLRRIAGEEGLRVVYASDGTPSEHQAFAARERIAPDDYVLSRDLGLGFEVSKLPYAVLVDREGIVRAKGLVNTREHVESLFEAERLGVGSLQQYLAADHTHHADHESGPELEVVHGGASS